ncbi:uncharacterized protein MELLADRAFT_112331 [Melampsora larici-populina 98AG31]|uniref:Uncharacterized protein n=1 Tax=Melampsora larici-populina (strain 98AG31 / pathotype 3-4-7) TaxID=747676 RepID=F4S652_MELLP|nr:uncharacterized protein MELLADRAFT_112331 [Melampsora larici-populina 98AG31]EGF99873.1 hypothetical protein MELLADRAFT_112331 [Melampsora larici-populina 98AG31]
MKDNPLKLNDQSLLIPQLNPFPTVPQHPTQAASSLEHGKGNHQSSQIELPKDDEISPHCLNETSKNEFISLTQSELTDLFNNNTKLSNLTEAANKLISLNQSELTDLFSNNTKLSDLTQVADPEITKGHDQKDQVSGEIKPQRLILKVGKRKQVPDPIPVSGSAKKKARTSTSNGRVSQDTQSSKTQSNLCNKQRKHNLNALSNAASARNQDIGPTIVPL